MHAPRLASATTLRRYALIVALASTIAATTTHAADNGADGPRLLTRPRRDVVFVPDGLARLEQLDPDGVRESGIRKLLYGLDATDRAGLIRAGEGSQAAELVGITDDTREEIAGMAGLPVADGASDTPAAPGALVHALEGALDLLRQSESPGVVSSVVVLSAASFGPDEDAATSTTELAEIVASFDQAGIALYVIAIGPFADKAKALADAVPHVGRRWVVETGNGLPMVFGGLLAAIQGYGGEPTTERMVPHTSDMPSVSVLPNAEWLQVDIVSAADAMGVVPFRVFMLGPGEQFVRPVVSGVGNAFYRVRGPAPGTWGAMVMAEREVDIARYVVIDNGIRVAHYFPSAVEIGRTAPLHFRLVVTDGPVETEAFTFSGSAYSLSHGEVTITDPTGVSETRAGAWQDADAKFPGEHRRLVELGGGRSRVQSGRLCTARRDRRRVRRPKHGACHDQRGQRQE
jgi:hypothetical protein